MNPALRAHVASRWIVAALTILWMSGAGAPRAIAQPCEDGEWRRWNEQPLGRMLIAYDSARGVVVGFAWQFVSFTGQRSH